MLKAVLFAAALAPLAASAALAQAPQLPPTPIEAARLSAHDKVLASDAFEGRGPGTPGEVKTIDYISAQFRAAGLQPGGDPDGRGGRRWTEDVPLARFEIDGPITASLSVAGETLSLTQGEQIAIRAAQLPVNEVAISAAPLVFVGYGVNAPERQWDDFKGVDLHGKIAVVLVNDPDFEADLGGRFDGKAMTYYGRWTYKYEEAARQGALGVLVIHETAPASYGWATVKNSNVIPMFDIVRSDPSKVHPLLEAWIQRDLAVDLFRRSGLDFEAEKKKAQSAEFRPIPLNATLSTRFKLKAEQVVSHNVVGRLLGKTRPEETVLYGAHWDHLGVGPPDARGDRIYNGAVDNASGVAALLELARVFAHAPRTDRSVVFIAFTAEEKNLLGAEAYGQKPLYPLAKTVALLNMDVMQVHGPARDVSAQGRGSSELDDMLAAAAQAQGRRFTPDPHPEEGHFYRADHFALAKLGVPALTLGQGFDLLDGGLARGDALYADYRANHYHQPADEWDPAWDWRGAAIDAGLLYGIGRDLATSNRWPGWKPNSEFRAVRDASAAARQ